MNDADASMFCVPSSRKPNRLAVDTKRSIIVGDDTGQNFHQGAFACTVLAANGNQTSFGNVKGNTIERLDGGKAFPDPLHRYDRLGHKNLARNARGDIPRGSGFPKCSGG